jgi:hypothetical protein
MDLTPTDFLSGLGGLGNLPHPYEDQQQVIGDQQQNQAGQQRLALGALKLGAIQQQQQQAEQYQTDVADAIKTGRFGALYAKYPDQQKQLQAAHDALDEPTQRATERDLFAVSSFIKNGATDSAKSLLQKRIDADRAAGQDPSDDQQMLDALNNGDPAHVKAAADMALYAILPADKRAEIFGKQQAENTEGKVVGKAIGHYEGNQFHVDYRDPDEGQIREIKVTDPVTGQETTQFVRVGGGSEGGGQASGGGAPSGSGGAPLSVRTNNPGAIRFDPNNNWQGQVGNADGFVQFATAADGARAHQKLIANQIKNGFDTPLAWAQHYAPASDGNDPAAYAQTIANGLGIGVNDKIPLGAVPKMAALSARVESGGTPARPSGPAAAPGVVASYVTKPAGSSAVDPNLTGPAVLSALPRPMAARVQQLLDGRSILTAREKASPQGQALLQAANQADPLYDESVAPARVQAYKQFTGNGKAAQVASSGNRLAYHLNDLYRDSLALAGPDTGFSPLNTALAATGQTFEPAAAARYDAVLPFISGELQKLTKNGTSTEGETKLIMSNLSRRQSASTRAAAIQQVVELAEGQFKPFRDQYQSVFGDDKNPPVDFTPTTAKIFDHIKRGDAPLTVDGNGNVVEPKARAGPPHVKSRAEAMALAPGTQFIDPSGKVRVRP